jgi:gliding-associated putative ABC transporter substrate-binding component GldG
MKKILSSKYWWVVLLLILVVINYIASVLHFRLDLTEEKRYTLSTPTKRLLKNLRQPVSITVFLSGDLPAGFKKLSKSTEELLQEFRELSGNKVQFTFEKPGEGLDDSAKAKLIDSLYMMGISPTNVKAQLKKGESEQQQYVYPGAIIHRGDRAIGVDLLKGQSFEGGLNSLNKAEALLEYKFASNIQKVTTDSLPIIGYVLGNGEPLSYNVYDLIQRTLIPNYRFGWVPLDSFPIIPNRYDALVVVKPTIKFTDEQKLKLDQYVMRGGKIIWLIDQLYAEMDSLARTKSDFVAFDRGLNLDDLLFKYGVRINQDLVQDLQCEKVPLVVGNIGNQPQMEFLPFPYFPLLSCYSNHPIAKNLDNVLSIFANSIDTVKAPGINKTVLLATSDHSRVLSTPAIVSWNSVKVEEDAKTYTRAQIPVAMLLEGKFNSLYTNRIASSTRDSLDKVYNHPFQSSTDFENKMIVISDADIVMNVVTQKEGPLYMGMHQFNKYQYANKDFFQNCLEYLTNSSGILESRSKDYTLRLLDTAKVEEKRAYWQFFNIGIPTILVALLGLVFTWLRKRKYAAE